LFFVFVFVFVLKKYSSGTLVKVIHDMLHRGDGSWHKRCVALVTDARKSGPPPEPPGFWIPTKFVEMMREKTSRKKIRGDWIRYMGCGIIKHLNSVPKTASKAKRKAAETEASKKADAVKEKRRKAKEQKELQGVLDLQQATSQTNMGPTVFSDALVSIKADKASLLQEIIREQRQQNEKIEKLLTANVERTDMLLELLTPRPFHQRTYGSLK
jgi:hypothetical protein